MLSGWGCRNFNFKIRILRQLAVIFIFVFSYKMQTLSLRKFDPSKIKQSGVIVILGKRGTGKSHLIRDILYSFQDVPHGTVITHEETFYSETIPSLQVHNEYDLDITKQVVKEQKRRWRKRNHEDAATDDFRTSLIFDNCGSWRDDQNLRCIFMNGRCLMINLIIAMSMGTLTMPPALRTNVDYVFIFRETYYGNKKVIYENYAGIFPTFETFCATLDQVTSTEKYNCLVIDNTARSNKLEDNVFWYVAQDM